MVVSCGAVGLLTVIMGNAFQDREIELERVSLKLKDKTSDFEMHVKTSCVYKSEAGLLIRYARKTYELNKKGFTGVYTADDILHM